MFSHTEGTGNYTSGAYRDMPMTSHRCAYSTLVSPAPYFFSGSVSKGRKRFQSPSALAFPWQGKKESHNHWILSLKQNNIKKKVEQGVVAPILNPNTWKAEVCGSLEFEMVSDWCTC